MTTTTIESAAWDERTAEIATLHGIIALVEWLRCPAHTMRGRYCACRSCTREVLRDYDAATAARLGGLPAVLARAEQWLADALDDDDATAEDVTTARRDVERLRERLAVVTRLEATRAAHGDLCMCVECCGTRRAA